MPESHKSGISEYHNAGIPAQYPTIKTERKKKEPTVKLTPVKELEEAPGEKVKATYYLSAEVVEALEDGWIKLRRLTLKDLRGQISKSLIMEIAIQMALEDLERQGKSSQIAKRNIK